MERAWGLDPRECALLGICWERDWSSVRVEYRSGLFYSLNELDRKGVRHTKGRLDLLTLWLDIT